MDQVVVVGAGIGGLAATLMLSRASAQVTLVERAEYPSEVGAALALQPNGMAILDCLGLLPEAVAASARIDRMDIRSATGRKLMSAGMPDLGPGLDHAIAIRRTDLHRLLLEAVSAVGTVQKRFGCTVLSADPGGAVTITSAPEGGPPAGSTTLSADLIVGADGVSSVVRRTGGFNSRVSAGSTYVRAIVEGRANPWFEEYWTPLGSFGHAPLGGDTTYFWAAAHVDAASEAVSRRDLRSLQQQWRRVLPVAADLLEKVGSFDDLLVNTVRRVDCRRWFSGRLVLLGDSAHAMAPNLGQGANSALVDALILAEYLATAPSVTEALARYDQHRRPTARRLQNIAGTLQRLCGLEQATAVRIRDALFIGLARLPQVTEKSIRRALAPDVQAAKAASVLGRN